MEFGYWKTPAPYDSLPLTPVTTPVILETTSLRASDRADAVRLFYEQANMSMTLDPRREPPIDTKVLLWEINNSYFIRSRSELGECSLQRTSRQVVGVSEGVLDLSIQLAGSTQRMQGGRTSLSRPGEMGLLDLAQTFSIDASDHCETITYQIGYEQLGLSRGTIEKALGGLRTSPLYGLVRGHLVGLLKAIGTLPDVPSRSMLANSTTELVRALISSVGGEEFSRTAAVHDSLRSRIASYVHQHLNDPNLTVRQIARQNNISVRQLHKVWSGNDLTMTQWIIAERLAGALGDLAGPGTRATTIAAIARRWGFTDAAYFSRRFRDAYGLSPREWRSLHQVTSAGK